MPASSTIASAVLEVYCFDFGGPVRLYRLTEDWAEDEPERPIPVEEMTEHRAGRCPVIWMQNTRSLESPEGEETDPDGPGSDEDDPDADSDAGVGPGGTADFRYEGAFIERQGEGIRAIDPEGTRDRVHLPGQVDTLTRFRNLERYLFRFRLKK